MRLPLRGGSSHLAALRQHVRDGSGADLEASSSEAFQPMAASGQKQPSLEAETPARSRGCIGLAHTHTGDQLKSEQ